MGTPQAGTDAGGKGNTFDPQVAQQFLNDIKRLEGEAESRKGQHMAWNKRQRELINTVYDRARDAGIPTRAFKAYVKKLRLEEKADAVFDGLEEEDQDIFSQLEQALGGFADTPLGQAAMSAAGQGGEEKDLRPPHLQRREAQRKKDREANAAGLDAAGGEAGNGAEKLSGLKKKLN